MLKWQRLLVTAPRYLGAGLVLPNCNGASILDLSSKYLYCLLQADISRNSCNQSLLFLLKSYLVREVLCPYFKIETFKKRLNTFLKVKPLRKYSSPAKFNKKSSLKLNQGIGYKEGFRLGAAS